MFQNTLFTNDWQVSMSFYDDWTRFLPHGVLLAVSGGVDSTAMLHGFLRAAAERTNSLAVGHVNHRLRGEESDADAESVRYLAEKHGLRSFEYRIEPKDWEIDKSGSVEAAARRIRYDFLTRTAEEQGLRYVAVAHTADDQAETVLHRILRGTGLSGLGGMAPARLLSPAVSLVRPLLGVRRKELLDFLQRIDQPFRDDSSNFENEYTRNKIRNELLPLIREVFNPNVDEALLRLAGLARDSEEIQDAVLDVLTPPVDDPMAIDAAILRQPKPLVRAFFLRLWKKYDGPLRDMGLEQWNDLVDFLSRGDGKRFFPGSVLVERKGDRIAVRFIRKE